MLYSDPQQHVEKILDEAQSSAARSPKSPTNMA
jgi:hypothetical protein